MLLSLLNLCLNSQERESHWPSIILILVTEGQGQVCGHGLYTQGVPVLGLMLCYSKLSTISCLNFYFKVNPNGTGHMCEQGRHTQYVMPCEHRTPVAL